MLKGFGTRKLHFAWNFSEKVKIKYSTLGLENVELSIWVVTSRSSGKFGMKSFLTQFADRIFNITKFWLTETLGNIVKGIRMGSRQMGNSKKARFEIPENWFTYVTIFAEHTQLWTQPANRNSSDSGFVPENHRRSYPTNSCNEISSKIKRFSTTNMKDPWPFRNIDELDASRQLSCAGCLNYQHQVRKQLTSTK